MDRFNVTQVVPVVLEDHEVKISTEFLAFEPGIDGKFDRHFDLGDILLKRIISVSETRQPNLSIVTLRYLIGSKDIQNECVIDYL